MLIQKGLASTQGLLRWTKAGRTVIGGYEMLISAVSVGAVSDDLLKIITH